MLTESFETNKPCLIQFKVFKSNLQSVFHQAFRKIRFTKTKPRKETKGTGLQRQRKDLKIKIRLKKNKANKELEEEVPNIEDNLSKEAENNLKYVREMCKLLSGNLLASKKDYWFLLKHREIANSCLEHISSVVEVSSCS